MVVSPKFSEMMVLVRVLALHFFSGSYVGGVGMYVHNH
jgi:hypothetical protein